MLKKIAVMILDQPTSIGTAERVWKVFGWIHDKRRNRMSDDNASKLVECHWNLRIANDLEDPAYEAGILQPYTEA